MESHVNLWIAAAVVGWVLLGVVVFYRRRRKESNPPGSSLSATSDDSRSAEENKERQAAQDKMKALATAVAEAQGLMDARAPGLEIAAKHLAEAQEFAREARAKYWDEDWSDAAEIADDGLIHAQVAKEAVETYARNNPRDGGGSGGPGDAAPPAA